MFVNPTADPFNSGRGFYIDSTSTASVDSSKVQTVKGYGIRAAQRQQRLRDPIECVLRAQRRGRARMLPGIEVDYGTNDLVSGNFVRWTYGPEVLLDSTASAIATTNNLAGGGQLMRASRRCTGSSQVTSNAFNTNPQSNDLNPGSSASDGRSGLELNTSVGVQVVGNVVQGDSGSGALVDAVRFIGTRSGGSPTLLENNTIAGGR